GANPNTLSVDGMTPLMIVARGTNVAAAKVLMANGAHVNRKEAQRNQTALMWAAAQSQGEMVEALIQGGADVNARAVVNNISTASYNTSGFMEWPAQVSSEPRAGVRPSGGFT